MVLRIPRQAALAFGGLAIVVLVIGVWAALDVDRAADPEGPALAPRTSLDSVAYILAAPDGDRLYFQRATPGAEAELVATFSSAFGLHARGSTSPDGRRLVVVHPGPDPGAAIVSIVDAPSGLVTDMPVRADYLASFAWSADGRRVALARSGPPDAVGRVQVDILELDLVTFSQRVVGTTGPVFEAAPVAYAGSLLYVVTIDQSGSALLTLANGELKHVAQLSVGRTRGWILHPDAARLAYLDVIGAGAARAVVARVMLLATGETTMLPGEDDHSGIVWRPNADLPDVGGPGGSLQVTGQGSAVQTVFPVAWDPDGERLLARVTAGTADREADLEVISFESRLVLASGDVIPLGWVAGEG